MVEVIVGFVILVMVLAECMVHLLGVSGELVKKSKDMQRCICCYDLERGTRLSLCLRCTVKCTVYGLRTTSAYQCFYIAGMLIHDCERKLWLR